MPGRSAAAVTSYDAAQIVAHHLTRRAFLSLTAALAPLAGASRAFSWSAAEPGRLLARPQARPSEPPPPPGESPLGLADGRDGLLYVPRQSRRQRLPLLLLLHGATGSARGVTSRTSAFDLAEELGVVVVAPDSREVTWDIASGEPGPDLQFIDRALQSVFARVAVDSHRFGIAGFSDGASYALSLGLTNGDVVSHVIAFSPGFMKVRRPVGHPAIFISHGTRDTILPIDDTSRSFVSKLEDAEYSVRYREFPGGHTVPPDIAREAFRWMSG
jgi:phospholipase/carboxylesterase